MLALTVALPVAPVAATAAFATSHSNAVVTSHGDDDPAGHHSGRNGKSDDKGKHGQKGKKAHVKFNLGGRVTAVAADSVTFKVHGGKFKALRGTDLTVAVADGARVRRNGVAVTPADLVVGDHVRAKGVRGADGTWTANRVTAEARHQKPAPGDDNGGDDSVSG
jgi:hypothetical protein